jgi:GT2 family glycosyltransferase
MKSNKDVYVGLCTVDFNGKRYSYTVPKPEYVDVADFFTKNYYCGGVLFVRNECVHRLLSHSRFMNTVLHEIVVNAIKAKASVQFVNLSCVVYVGVMLKSVASELLTCNAGLQDGVVSEATDGKLKIDRTLRKEHTGEVDFFILSKDSALLTKCLDTLFDSLGCKNHNCHVLWNGTPEEYERMLRRYCQWVHFDFTNEPFNYSSYINFLLRKTKNDVVLVNDDIEFVSLDWLDNMINTQQKHKADVVGAKLMYPNNRPVSAKWYEHTQKLQHAGIHFDNGKIVNITDVVANKPEHNVIRQTKAVTFALVLLSRGTLKRVGEFDETFPLSFNDVDYCLRVNKCGGKVFYDPNAYALHSESLTRREDFDKQKDTEHLRLFLQKYGVTND